MRKSEWTVKVSYGFESVWFTNQIFCDMETLFSRVMEMSVKITRIEMFQRELRCSAEIIFSRSLATYPTIEIIRAYSIRVGPSTVKVPKVEPSPML